MSDTPTVQTEKGRSVIEAVPVLHPYLLALYPLLGLYAYNQESMQFSSTFRLAFVLLAVTLVLWLALGALFRNSYKAGLATSIIVVAGTSGWNVLEFAMVSFMAGLSGRSAPLYYTAFGVAVAAAIVVAVLYSKSSTWDRIRLGVLIAVASAVLLYLGDIILAPIFNRGPAWAILTYLVAVGGLLLLLHRWQGDMRKTTSTLNLFGGILLALSIANIAINRPANGHLEPAPALEATIPAGTTQPDIWFIAMDGYARADAMARLFGKDPRPFITALENRGFSHVPESTANYSGTIEALASCLNGLYIDDLQAGAGPVTTGNLVHWYHNNRTGAFLRANGYSAYASAPPHELLRPRGDVDHVLETRSLPTEFEVVFLESTAIARMLQATHYIRHRSLAELRHIVLRAEVLAKFDLLRELAVEEAGEPRFVQAHLALPNAPFLFGAEGQWPETVGIYTHGGRALFRGSMREYQERYTGQVEWLNHELLTLIDAIIEHSETPPVILLASMHGPVGPIGATQEQRELLMAQRYLNFMALHLPGDPDIPRDLSPVNLFRLALNHSLGLDEPILPNRRFLSTGVDAIEFEALP